MTDIIEAMDRILKDTDFVLGWTLDEDTGVAEPARFHSSEQAAQAVLDSTCVHNLAVHLPRLKESTVGIVAKGCDARSIVQLIVEGAVERERVKVIGVTCAAGMLDVKAIWRRHGYGARIDDTGDSLSVGGDRVDRNEYLMGKCRDCGAAAPVIHDELIEMSGPGRDSAPTSSGGSNDTTPDGTLALKQRFDAMPAAGRRAFWREQFSRCIRCYACREACPMCFCRDVCTMQTTDPHWAGGDTNARESEMVQLVRVNHLAGRCTGCGECERACPVGIPLMLLLGEQNNIIEEMFDYRAGTDLEAKSPLLTFDIKNDSWGGG
ncbi:MAG: 4Fe-4S dicluster domain-containing protein [Thermoleophilia bacterium]|jgi:ferredoxin